ncbi:MAG: NlpC/P60 family protein [Bacteroides sp.]|nr:NlpC/P60 family protein [Bacteroides sp.]
MFFFFLLFTLLLAGCRSQREVTPASAIEADHDFYRTYSEKLGYSLGGYEDPVLIREVSSWLGTPHRYAGTTREGADCSGFVMEVFRTVYQVSLPRSSAEMASKARTVSKVRLQEGDLVFFRTSGGRKISHVGIYLSTNKFIHASSSRGVIVSDLNEPYYRRTFAHAGRVN